MTNIARQFVALSLTVVASALLLAGAIAPASTTAAPMAQTTTIVA